MTLKLATLCDHTGLICSRFFQNYAFKGWLSLETMKLWLLVLTKILFFNDLNYKADIGQHFLKSEKSARRRHRHNIIKTNLKTLVSPLLMRPQGSQGCQKMLQDPVNMPVEVWCAKIAPKLKNIWKGLRRQGFFDCFPFNFDVFWSLCLLGAILAQKENSFIFRKKNVIFWHPRDPWGRINSGKNFFEVQTATVHL